MDWCRTASVARCENVLELRPDRGCDHPRDDALRTQEVEQPRHDLRPDVAGGERACTDRRRVRPVRLIFQGVQIGDGETAIRAGRRRDGKHLRRQVDTVNGGDAELRESPPNGAGAAAQIDHRLGWVGQNTDQQLGDPVTSGEPQLAEDVGVVGRRPFGVQRRGLFHARDRPGTPDRISFARGADSIGHGRSQEPADLDAQWDSTPLRERFASYIALSASPTRWVEIRLPGPAYATPTLAVITIS